jgi:hypothetical protein
VRKFDGGFQESRDPARSATDAQTLVGRLALLWRIVAVSGHRTFLDRADIPWSAVGKTTVEPPAGEIREPSVLYWCD